MTIAATTRAALASLKQASTKQDYGNLKRFGITTDKAFGVSMANIQKIAKPLGKNHELAAALWKTGWYEARMLASFVDEPAKVTPAQMDRWCRDFDNWGICDTVCFKLFDQTPHAFKKVTQWSNKKDEFVKRGAFALLASLALHDKRSGDAAFLKTLPLIERAATDDRNFVKKGVSWALRGIGHRSPKLHAAAIALAASLAESPDRTARWSGKDALRDLKRLA
jgi:3-methyladenine DNA glycosylase AlkD